MTTSHDAQATLGGILICGGKSRRMGADKALLKIDGETMLSRAARLLHECCLEVLIACGPEPRYGELGFPLALDAEPDGGPLAGIRSGLAAIGTSHAMVLACDMPKMTSALIGRLFEEAREKSLDVCYLASASRVEPLCAIYSRRCLPAIEFALANGVRKVTGFLPFGEHGLGRPARDGNVRTGSGASLRVGELPLHEFTPDTNPICNVNTPEDLSRVQGDLEGGR